jgi:hypothetical protein
LAEREGTQLALAFELPLVLVEDEADRHRDEDGDEQYRRDPVHTASIDRRPFGAKADVR